MIAATVVAAFAAFAGAFAGAKEDGLAYLEANKLKEGVTTLASGLQYRVLKSGPADGPSPSKSTRCKCHYSGRTIEGEEFDSSYKRGEPTTFAPNQVISGWTEAMQLMKEGDKWELVIPSELAYGRSSPTPLIKPDSVLVFDMELVKVGA
ncbi:FKBP-type peptidyl-prolyl cis-trans isomerase [Ostreococcus tauri]|uniref:peptidylprolyl isomerase n=1 Tax=Ostreococcus tauri TaxID=70448 RepID=A0A1Y5I9W1_OSTTA|nr:FKBP-type peptidyl-prolyl cis-trans isomerase [Ostreococcus tauri]